MSPGQMLEMDITALVERSRRALGVNGRGDAAHIMEHSIAQACLELQAVERELEHDPNNTLVYIVMGIRQRLELAAERAGSLARWQPKESEAADG